jgi:HD-GYP domain-containing protein (c-di-GMP phosphodiesterase class II)
MDKKEIPVEELEIGMYVVELDRPWLGTPFVFQGFPITSERLIDEVKKRCRTVFIDVERQWTEDDAECDPGAPQKSVRGPVIYKDATPVETEIFVAKEVYSACEKAVKTSFDTMRATGDLDPEPLTVAVGKMTRSIERNPHAMMLLFRIKKKSSEAFSRAVETSIHMITFGRFLGYPSDRLELLGLAGLLLDIGMLKLPDTILQNKDSLTPEQYELTKTHVLNSVEIIRASEGMPAGIDDIVLQHHERKDGSGYPQGLRNWQITIDGAIAGLVDSYSALISKRVYAGQESPSNALSKIYKIRGKLFNEGLVEQFIQCLGIYPIGSVVQLNTGEVGIVIAQNLVRRLQPRVLMVADERGEPIRPQVIVDLTREPKSDDAEPLHIRRTLPRDQLPIDPEEFFLETIH